MHLHGYHRHIGLLLFILIAFSYVSGRVRTQESFHGPLDIDCEECHDSNDWQSINFNHDTTHFPLTGQHRDVACISCHKDLVFRGTQRECYQCHRDVHNGELGYECGRCHTTTVFTIVDNSSGFHDATRFPLRGAHLSVMCADCHKDTAKGHWKGLNTACVSCHYSDYKSTKNPDHTLSGFSTDCTRCHNETEGFISSFDHAKSEFPLTGTHKTLLCNECHKSNIFGKLQTACVSCHLTNYQQTTIPNHMIEGYSQQCDECHNTVSWNGWFDHQTFPLTGAHRNVSCTECHKNNVFSGLQTACVSCHLTDYQQTTSPNHALEGFPQQCEECHTTGSWEGEFIHRSFPIYTGKHAGKWNSCSDCHNIPGTYQQFTCFTCHSPNIHQEPYTSDQCYSCHPDGREDD